MLTAGTELMTGFISDTNPFSRYVHSKRETGMGIHLMQLCDETKSFMLLFLSTIVFRRITIAGLQDLGYTVDFTQAAVYNSGDLDSSCICATKRELSAVKPVPTEKDDTSSPKRRRKLSEEGRAQAVAYGQSLLVEAHEQHKRDQSIFQPLFDADELAFIGDKIVNVVYAEDGELYDVLVVST